MSAMKTFPQVLFVNEDSLGRGCRRADWENSSRFTGGSNALSFQMLDERLALRKQKRRKRNISSPSNKLEYFKPNTLPLKCCLYWESNGLKEIGLGKQDILTCCQQNH